MSQRTPATFRFLLRAYPRSFRERFGPEMAQLLLDRRREGANGVGLALREVVDVLRTAPRLHLETQMSRNLVTVVLSTLAVAGTVLGGPIGLLVAVVLAAILAVVVFAGGAERPITAPPTSRWWSWFAAAAASALVAFVVLAIDGDELTSLGWLVVFTAFNAAIVLAVIGAGVTASHAWHRRRQAPAA